MWRQCCHILWIRAISRSQTFSADTNAIFVFNNWTAVNLTLQENWFHSVYMVPKAKITTCQFDKHIRKDISSYSTSRTLPTIYAKFHRVFTEASKFPCTPMAPACSIQNFNSHTRIPYEKNQFQSNNDMQIHWSMLDYSMHRPSAILHRRKLSCSVKPDFAQNITWPKMTFLSVYAQSWTNWIFSIWGILKPCFIANRA